MIIYGSQMFNSFQDWLEYITLCPPVLPVANRVGKRLITAVPPTPPGIRVRTAAVSD
jgi:hypothetical protein